MAHIRQSRPDSGLGFQVRVLKTLQDVPSLLGSGCGVCGRVHGSSPGHRRRCPCAWLSLPSTGFRVSGFGFRGFSDFGFRISGFGFGVYRAAARAVPHEVFVGAGSVPPRGCRANMAHIRQSRPDIRQSRPDIRQSRPHIRQSRPGFRVSGFRFRVSGVPCGRERGST